MATKKGSKRFIWVALTLLVLGGAAFFSLIAFGTKPTKPDAEKIVKAERIDLARSVVATGKIQPLSQVEIKSKASGIILRLPVNVGDTVHKGDVICELDQNDLAPVLRQQEAALHVAEANVRSVQAEYERYKVDAQGAEVPFLKRDMERAATMLTNGLIARNSHDEAEKNYRLAVQKQESAKASLATAAATISKAQASLEQQRAVVGQAEENIRNATIRAPIGGVVLSRDSEVGTAVSSILVLGSGATLIMTIGDLGEVFVKGKVDESDVGKIYVGQPARIKVESFRDQIFSGRVTRISPMGAEKDNVTTFEVRVSISNEKRLLKAQMSANAEIVLEERSNVLAIPEGAIVYNKDKTTAVNIPDATAEKGMKKLAVKTGISNGTKTEILSGLTDGQQVVLP